MSLCPLLINGDGHCWLFHDSRWKRHLKHVITLSYTTYKSWNNMIVYEVVFSLWNNWRITPLSNCRRCPPAYSLYCVLAYIHYICLHTLLGVLKEESSSTVTLLLVSKQTWRRGSIDRQSLVLATVGMAYARSKITVMESGHRLSLRW